MPGYFSFFPPQAFQQLHGAGFHTHCPKLGCKRPYHEGMGCDQGDHAEGMPATSGLERGTPTHHPRRGPVHYFPRQNQTRRIARKIREWPRGSSSFAGNPTPCALWHKFLWYGCLGTRSTVRFTHQVRQLDLSQNRAVLPDTLREGTGIQPVQRGNIVLFQPVPEGLEAIPVGVVGRVGRHD